MPWTSTAGGADGSSVPVRAAERSEFSLEEALEGIEEVALAVGSASVLPEIVAAVALGGVRLPGQPSITVGIAPRQGDALRLVALEGFDRATLEKWGTIDREAETPLTDALRSGELLYIESRDEMLDRYPHLAADIDRGDRQRWAAVPMVSPTGPAGVIGLGWSDDGVFTDAERLYLVTLGRLGGEAIRRSARELERRDLVVMLAEASDRERIEIARDLHDHAVQRLAAAMIGVGSLRTSDEVEPAVASGLRSVEREMQTVIETMRDMIADLHPPDMDGMTLAPAIRDFATWLTHDALDVRVTGGEELAVSSIGVTSAFRIVQEALANVIKHADAATVEVVISVGNDLGERRLRVEVRDDGVGFAETSGPAAGHIGIRTMTERAENIGGTVELSNDRGAVVVIQVPLAD